MRLKLCGLSEDPTLPKEILYTSDGRKQGRKGVTLEPTEGHVSPRLHVLSLR